MKRHAPMTLVALALALGVLAPLVAAAAPGTITGLTAAPSPATAGGSVTITVNGTPPACGGIELDYGDGTPKATLAGPFPLSNKHTYQKAGTFTLQAKPGQTCQGQASATLTVKQSNLAGLLAGLEAFPPAPLPGSILGPLVPTITRCTGVIADDSVVFVSGSSLGDDKGTLSVRGLKDWQGNPKPDFNLDTPIWTDLVVAGKVPAGYFQWSGLDRGMMDQQVALQIVTKAGAKSNECAINFEAVRDVRQLPMEDMVVLSCPFASCNSGEVVNPQWSFFTSNYTLAGLHHTDFPAGKTGTDKYSVKLKNGWVLDGGEELASGRSNVCHHLGDAGCVGLYVNPAKGFTPGSTSATLSIDYGLGWDFWGAVFYRVALIIRGPNFVPWK